MCKWNMIVDLLGKINGLDIVQQLLFINKLEQYKAYSTFFREKLKNIKNEIEHIITYEK